MKKAVLQNRIYLNADSKLAEHLSAQLTYTIPPKMKGQFPEIIKNFRRISSSIVSIPAGRIDLIPEDYLILDERSFPSVEFPKFRYPLRASQQEIYDEVEGSCIINAQPSWGKTFMGIAIATKLKLKTLVITHTTFLRNQWEGEIKKTLGITPPVIGGGDFDIDGPIVISNVQTLVKHIDKIKNTFGLVIIDEAHHTPATTFTGIVDYLNPAHRIGLTGTINRKDGKHVLFQDYFGDKIFKPDDENAMTPTILIVELPIVFPAGKFWANRVTELETHNKQYQTIIRDLAERAANKGHKVLVLGSRKEFLYKMAEDTHNAECVLITGDIKDPQERQDLLAMIGKDEVDIVYGTASLFSEGISESALSCVILATPINNESLLTQIIGRIVRIKEGKPTPLVIDIHLKGNTPRNQARERMAFYIKKGYKIQYLKN